MPSALSRSCKRLLAGSALLVVVLCPSLAATPNSIAVQGLFPDRAILLLDGVRRVVKLGEHTPEGVTLLAVNAERATLRAGNRTFEIAPGEGSYALPRPRQTAAMLRLVPSHNGHYLVDGTINGQRVTFLVDTGATVVAINRKLARELGLLYRTDGRKGKIETASGLVDAWYVTFDSVGAQALSLKGVEGVVIDAEYPSTALLGQSFLNTFALRRDGTVLEISAHQGNSE